MPIFLVSTDINFLLFDIRRGFYKYKLFQPRAGNASIWYLPDLLLFIPTPTHGSYLPLQCIFIYANFEGNQFAIWGFGRQRRPFAFTNNNLDGFILFTQFIIITVTNTYQGISVLTPPVFCTFLLRL